MWQCSLFEVRLWLRPLEGARQTMTTKFLRSFLVFASLSAAASRSDMLVSSDWLTQHLTDSKLVILHVSANRAVYDAGHIPGARFVALSELVVNRDGIPNEVP